MSRQQPINEIDRVLAMVGTPKVKSNPRLEKKKGTALQWSDREDKEYVVVDLGHENYQIYSMAQAIREKYKFVWRTRGSSNDI
jgi:hypothetical protein